jgi:CheY-like chemotaxis protein
MDRDLIASTAFARHPVRETLSHEPATAMLFFEAWFAECFLMTNGTRTVLIIDDEVVLADLLAAIVESANCRPVIAADGAEGLALARSLRPDVVFCDMSMPGLTGAEVFRAIRDEPSTAHVPRVLISGHEHPDLHAIGADAFLAKPFRPDAVLRLLDSLLPQQNELAA